MLTKGQKINDRYEIIKTIGEGGMANVYLANDTILDRKVAIKVLRGDLSNDEKFIRRFQREALSVSNLSHPNIVEVYDVGEEDGQYYIVMEYIEGKTLKQLLKKRETLTLPEVIDIMLQLTDGLAHAHESYIIHRDIKPQNIMILDNGLVKITDFGIAMALNATQLTQTNSVMGSVHYLPPEQANGKSATVKSDIYSLGILMYELITGSVPFKGDNAVEIALKHMKEKIPSIRKQNPTIPQSVENIVIKATAKNPRNRYDSVKEMHDDLEVCMEKENAKKVTFEYPENDIDDSEPITKKKEKNKIEKPNVEYTEKKEESIEEDILETPKKRNTVILLLTGIVLFLLIIAGIFWLSSTKEVKDVIVPNVVGKEIEKAIKELEKLGFKYTIESKESETVAEGLVIRTNPKAGSTRKKGDTITIIESLGGEYHYLEDYTGKDYTEIKAKLELIGVNVNIEKKDVENKDEYKGKEQNIIDQKPIYNKDEKKVLEKGDTVTLYIPNIVNEYPDMIAENWSLSDVMSFAEEYKINVSVLDKNGTIIPNDKLNDFLSASIIEQSRPPKDTIIEGITLKVKILATYELESSSSSDEETE
ncbi:MAG: Stk1 family PASTA domain-containing Ser/Thr kinase [Clostridium sp.]|jgi:serine/threonine protein kinase|nr:Stk1 family PASTA domain-containing Ser/Thr kinase [Clostridium sp.]